MYKLIQLSSPMPPQRMSQASPAMRVYPRPTDRVQRFQTCVLMSMAFGVRGKVHITTTISVRTQALGTPDIIPGCSTIDTSCSGSCTLFAAAQPPRAITMHILATSLARNNRFSGFAIPASHCFKVSGKFSPCDFDKHVVLDQFLHELTTPERCNKHLKILRLFVLVFEETRREWECELILLCYNKRIN